MGPDGPVAALSGGRVVILGGLGFIGSNLADALTEVGADVVLIDSLAPRQGGQLQNVDEIEPRPTIEIGDVRDRSLLDRYLPGADVVFNLVGQTSHLDSMRDPLTDLDANCAAQLAILEGVRRHAPAAKLVFTSTRQVYGRPQYLPVDERHPVVPVDVNGIHKFAGEEYHRLYREVHGLPISVLRLTNTFGPRMRVRDARQTFLGWWIRLALAGGELRIFGDGEQRRDLNYVDDVVDALARAAVVPPSGTFVYNLGSEQVVTLAELASLLIDLAGGGTVRRVPFPVDRKAIDIGDYYGDFSAIRDELDWAPRVELEVGLARTLAFFRANSESRLHAV
jgi:nucleoside-diphosphate-sugar epimerase